MSEENKSSPTTSPSAAQVAPIAEQMIINQIAAAFNSPAVISFMQEQIGKLIGEQIATQLSNKSVVQMHLESRIPQQTKPAEALKTPRMTEKYEPSNNNTIARIRQEIPDPQFSEYFQRFDDADDNDDEDGSDSKKEKSKPKGKFQSAHDHEEQLLASKRAQSQSQEDQQRIITDSKSTSINNNIKFPQQTDSNNNKTNNLDYSDGDMVQNNKHIYSNLNNLRKTMFSAKKKKKKHHYDSSDYSSSDSSSDDDKKNSSRTSMVGRIARAAVKKKKKKEGINGVIYMNAPPSSDHIRLDKLSALNVYEFLDKILHYEASSGLLLQVHNLINPKIRDLLLSQYKGLTLDKYYNMEISKLLTILQMESRPKTHISFYNELQEHTFFRRLPDDYKPGYSNFKIFHDAYIVYKTKFIQLYELMAEDNADNIPPLKNKEGGLIRVFLEKIPYDYGQSIYGSLIKANGNKDNFKDIKDFVHKFTVVVEDHFHKCEENAAIFEHFTIDKSNKFSNRSNNNQTNSSDRNNNKSHYSKNSHNSNQKNNNGHKTFFNHNHASSFHHIDQSPHDQASEEQEDSTEAANHNNNDNYHPNDQAGYSANEEPINNQQYDGDQRSNIDTDEDSKHELANTTKSEETSEDIMQDKLAELMFADSGKSSGKPYSKTTSVGCLQMLLHDVCKRGDKCTFSHETNVLERSYSYYLDLLTKSKFKPRNNNISNHSTGRYNNNTYPSSNKPYQSMHSNNHNKLLLTRPKPPPPPRDNRAFHHLSHDTSS